MTVQTDTSSDQSNSQVIIDSTNELVPLYGPAGELVRNANVGFRRVMGLKSDLRATLWME